MKTSLNKPKSSKIANTRSRPSSMSESDLKEKDILILKQFDLNHKFGPCYGMNSVYS